MKNKPLISIVTPCYNEEQNVENHFSRVLAVIAPFREKYEFEHIYTDNCSKDRTFELLVELSKRQPNVRVLRFSRNIGADRAIFLGLQHAKGDAVVLIQADLQDPPDVIPEFIQGWESGFDVVYGQIKNRREGLLLRSCRKLFYKMIAKFSETPVPENAGEFRLTSRRALDALLQYKADSQYLRGVVALVGFRQKPVAYVRQQRVAGRTSASIPYLIGYALNGLLSTSVVPIRAVSLFGFLLAVLGFVLTIFVIAAKLLYPAMAPHGFTTLASLITFFSGAQMLAIGIVGEYIRKIHLQTLNRPQGFIQDKVNFE